MSDFFKYMKEYDYKQKFIETTKLYFKPLTEKWFWIYVFPFLVVISFLGVYFEHIAK